MNTSSVCVCVVCMRGPALHAGYVVRLVTPADAPSPCAAQTMHNAVVRRRQQNENAQRVSPNFTSNKSASKQNAAQLARAQTLGCSDGVFSDERENHTQTLTHLSHTHLRALLSVGCVAGVLCMRCASASGAKKCIYLCCI